MKEGARRSGRGQVTPLAGNPLPAWPMVSEPQGREFLPSPHSSRLRVLPAALAPALFPFPGPGRCHVILRLFLNLASHVGFLTGVNSLGAGGPVLGMGLANAQPFTSVSPTLLFPSFLKAGVGMVNA